MDMKLFRQSLAKNNKKQLITEADNVSSLQKAVAALQKKELQMLKDIDALYADGIKDVLSIAKGLIGKTISIEEPISSTMRGRLVYKVTAVHGAHRDFSYDSDGPIILEYSAELVKKPDNYRGAHQRTVGKEYKKRISLDRLKSGVLKLVS
jgi:hypothetical protein